MVQYSVYARVCCGYDGVEKHIHRLELNRPANGAARVLVLTEKQYESMILLIGERTPEDEPAACEQMTIFLKK